MIPRLALLLALAPCIASAQPQGQNKTAWRFGPPVDGRSPRVAAILEATGKYDTNPPLLDVRCTRGETTAAIYWPQYLGTGPTLVMKWRTNDATMKAEDWTLPPGSSGVFHPTPIPFLRALFGKTELIVTMTPHSGQEATATFPIAGVEGAVMPIIDTCKPGPEPEPRSRVVDAPPQGQRRTGWGIMIDKGSGEVIATVGAIGGTYGRGVGPLLRVRCIKGKTEAAVQWPMNLGAGPTVGVKWRTNDSPEKTESWTLDPGGRVVSHPTPIPFLKSLFGKTELIVNATPHREAEPAVTFPITGVEAAMKRISDACRWEPAPGPQPKVGAPK